MQAILDYRAAKAGLDLFNRGQEGAEELSRHPELARIVVEMRRAQMETESGGR